MFAYTSSRNAKTWQRKEFPTIIIISNISKKKKKKKKKEKKEETRKQKTADYKTENKLIGTRNSRTDEVTRYNFFKGEKKRGDKDTVSAYINITSVGAHPSYRKKKN